MKYAYENLSSTQFEDLVRAICRRLLGVGVQAFSTGPDGGRDAKFVGIAERFPSKASPWNGTTIIQAKHTIGYNKKFSDTSFFSESNSSCVIAKELPRIIKLRQSDDLDHYLLFSNRKMGANIGKEIESFVASKAEIPVESVYLCGVEQIEDWLKEFPDIPSLIALDPVDSPLLVSPDDLAIVIQHLADCFDEMPISDDQPPTPRVPYAKKNTINNMTAEYAEELRVRRQHLWNRFCPSLRECFCSS